jgi:branched-chain amino acid transport system ATP-binding protein
VRILETQGISINFGGLKAVDQFDTYIDEGEILSVIGPNGAGKTTLFNLITGFLHPTEGKVIYLKKDLTGLAPYQIAANGLVRTFQKTNIFSEVTVEEGIAIGFHMRRKCGIWQILLNGQEAKKESNDVQKQASEILGFCGLSSWAEFKGKNLPYGKQRILEIAVALAASPRLLLLDEPATGLNPKETQDLTELIRRIRGEKGITVCLIEHNMNVVIGISNRIVVLNYGKKITEGTPEEISKNKEVIEAYLGRGYGNAQGKSN